MLDGSWTRGTQPYRSKRHASPEIIVFILTVILSEQGLQKNMLALVIDFSFVMYGYFEKVLVFEDAKSYFLSTAGR